MERPVAPPRGYDIIGDVVVVRSNALEGIEPQVFIEAVRRIHPRIRAVYVKEGTFSEHRVSRLRLLWGTDVDHVVHREHGIRLYVPLHEAYYNPRLATEHRRIAETVVPGERVVDLFSGIGGFSLHIARCAEALVVANDINPAAVKALINSIVLNKRLLRGRIVVMMGDAAEAPDVLGEERWDRVIANLPHGSLGFVDVYRRLLRRGGLLHLYLVATGLEEAYSLAAKGFPENEWRIVSGRRVLEYAPYKYIYRVNLVRL